jgi:tetratricopeptide (TPR) repeat protein
MYKKKSKNKLFFILLIFILPSCSIIRISQKNDFKNKEIDSLEYAFCFYDADRAFMEGNLKDAAKLYRKCIRLNNKSAASYYQLANIYIQDQNYRDALFCARNAVKINPDNIWYQTILGILYKQNGLIEQSIDVYNDIIDNYRANTETYFELASLYLMKNKLNEAIQVYNQYEKKYGLTELISLEKIKIYDKLNDKENIYRELNKLISMYSDDPKYYGMLAEYYVLDGKYPEALEIYNKILEMDRSNGLVHLSLAEYYRKLKNYEKSFEETKLAFKSDNVELEDKIKIIQSYYYYTNKNDTLKEQAYTLINILLEVNPDDPQIHALYADFLVKDKQFAQAREQLKLITSIDKSKFIIWEQLLLIDNELSEYNLLYTDSKEALEYFPNQPSIYLFKGIAEGQLNKIKDALLSLKTGYDNTTDEKELKMQFMMQLGVMYHKGRNNFKSDSTFERILELDPSNLLVLNNYSYYLSVRGDSLEKAEKMSKKCIISEPDNSTYLDTYAWILFRLEKYSDALTYIEKAVKNGNGKDAVITEHYGDILFKTGNVEKAIEKWNIAFKSGKGSKNLEQKIKERRIID